MDEKFRSAYEPLSMDASSVPRVWSCNGCGVVTESKTL